MPRPLRIPDKGDVPPKAVAQRLGLDLERFTLLLPRLLDRGFPAPDPVTGNYSIEAVDRWRLIRHKPLFPEIHLAPGLTSARVAKDAAAIHQQRKVQGWPD